MLPRKVAQTDPQAVLVAELFKCNFKKLFVKIVKLTGGVNVIDDKVLLDSDLDGLALHYVRINIWFIDASCLLFTEYYFTLYLVSHVLIGLNERVPISDIRDEGRDIPCVDLVADLCVLLDFGLLLLNFIMLVD